ncbi:MAG: monofunctional biosynthetic peptidoglycan transglycosylase [Bdellovibrio sp. CG10_big_fil_rev_8_21_14_0_10_47_8]|nr:MAG: monofunctional biosynthetic peptidoglycan transglycosylase [Bdellovibrio sp. CG10_big_fil_rev_8_21_14_0_10_47_8]
MVYLTKKTLLLLAKVIGAMALVIGLVCLWLFSKIPTNQEIKGCLTTKMYHVKLCPSSGQYVRLSQISNYLQKSVVLSEDSSFWTHQGFDLQEIQNSLKSNLEKGRFVRGGSTITQQLAKNMFLSKEKTLGRKIVEAFITIRIEKVLSKKEILERYLNVVQFGKELFGVKQAAAFYFKKDPQDLDVVESTFLTFLLPNPEVYSKSFYKQHLTAFAQERLRQMIDRLYQYNRISEEEYLTAKSELEYFLTGKEPPVIDPAIDDLNEEEAEPSESTFY